MSNEANTAVLENTNNQPAAPAPVAVKSDLPKTLQDVSTTYFSPADIAEKGVAYIQHVSTLVDDAHPLIFNGNWASDGSLPPTHGVLVMPIGKTVKVEGENKRINEYIVIAAIPTAETLAQSEAGQTYIADAVQAALATKLRNSFTRIEDKTKAELPFTVEQFLARGERGAADTGMASYKKIAPDLVKKLVAKGVPVTVPLLRQTLQSAAFAQALFPAIKQVVWEKVIAAGKAASVELGLPVAIWENWEKTRATATVATELDDISFDDEAAA